jgi:hypothetical protein
MTLQHARGFADNQSGPGRSVHRSTGRRRGSRLETEYDDEQLRFRHQYVLIFQRMDQ